MFVSEFVIRQHASNNKQFFSTDYFASAGSALVHTLPPTQLLYISKPTATHINGNITTLNSVTNSLEHWCEEVLPYAAQVVTDRGYMFSPRDLS